MSCSMFPLSHALTHYQDNGFSLIEVPCLVSKAAINMTHQGEVESVSWDDSLFPIGSAEQGFLQMEINNVMPVGKFVALSPCVRQYDKPDYWHQGIFYKVELYINDTSCSVYDTLDVAFSYFTSILPKDIIDRLVKEETTEGFDINLNGIEIGSYGKRNINGISWVYGTGLAQPRFDKAFRQ